MEEKIERLRGILKDRLENHQKMRIAFEGIDDLRNALSFKEKEVELRTALEIFADIFPESSEG